MLSLPVLKRGSTWDEWKVGFCRDLYVKLGIASFVELPMCFQVSVHWGPASQEFGGSIAIRMKNGRWSIIECVNETFYIENADCSNLQVKPSTLGGDRPTVVKALQHPEFPASIWRAAPWRKYQVKEKNLKWETRHLSSLQIRQYLKKRRISLK